MSPRFFTPPLLLRKSDADLAALVRAGHEAAFSAIVLRHRAHLLRHCRRMLRDHRAEDAVQQTFVRALQALRSGTEVRELRPWLYRIARNVALDEISAGNSEHAELNDDWADPAGSDEIERRARLRDTLLAVEALPTRQRMALLRSVAGEPPDAIAQDLGVTSMAARQLLHRARVSVRAAVQALLPPPLLWLSRRVSSLSERLPRAAGAPAGAAPVAAKVAVAVVASASVAAPVAVIRHALSHPVKPAYAHRAEAHAAPDLVAAAPAPPSQPVVLRPAPVPVPAAKPRNAAPEAPRPSRPAPTPSAGVSASSPSSAPVGDGSASPGAAPATAAVAADAGASGTGGPGSGNAGPMASATASGPTGGAAGGSGSADGSSAAPSSGPSGG